jgi:hypothetical protein
MIAFPWLTVLLDVTKIRKKWVSCMVSLGSASETNSAMKINGA